MATAQNLLRLSSLGAHPLSSRMLAALIGLRPRPRRVRLDPRTLPDHLRRDMGFMDGNEPRGRRARDPYWPDWV